MKRLIVLLLIFSSGAAFAGPQDGILREYKELETELENRQRGEDVRKATLENNLMRAMRQALFTRFYHDYDEVAADVNPETLLWESDPAPNSSSRYYYYVKYKTYIAQFAFARDPEYFIQAPVQIKFLIDEEAGAHSGDQTGG